MSADDLQGSPPSDDDVAVVGMAGRFPGAPDVASFWAATVEGGSRLTRWHRDDDGSGTVAAGGLLADVDAFDAAAFGLTPAEADLLDPQHRVFAESCWLALEHAAVVPDDSLLVAVYASAAPSRYRPWAPDDVNGQYQRMIANAPDFLATRVAHLLDLRGEAINVQTACSSSLVAVHLACQSLQAGRSDVALAGGVSIDPDQHLGYRFQEGMVASPDGSSHPFDRRAQGAVPGSGSAVVVLQRLGDALAQGRRVHAVVRASAVNQDGRAKTSFMAPSVEGQSELIASALALADVPAGSLGYLEAHGTGTRIGDPIEVQAATQAFRSFTDRTGFCGLGSLKAAFGHLDRAAGAAGLIKAVHVVREGVAPPLVGFETANPDLELETSPFRVDTEARALDSATPHRAGVSAFGVGGTNAHVIVETPAAQSVPTIDSARPMVLVASAHSPEVLADLTSALAGDLRTGADAPGLGSVARTLGSGRVARRVRAAVVARDRAEAARELELVRGHPTGDAPGRVALLFAGQGAETVYRPEALMSRYAVFRDEIEHFADVLGCSPQSLLEGVSGGSPQVRAFAHQPSLGAVQVALARLAQHLGVEVGACCGSSIGEYAAAHLAGVLDHEGLVRALAVRAEAMARTAPGRLLSLSCSAALAQELLAPGMELAGDNAADRALVSGPLDAVDRQLEAAERAGVRARVLPGPIAPHSALMDEAAEQVAAAVAGAVPADPTVPVVSTVTGGWVGVEELADPAHWARHLRRPIRFREALRTLTEAGFDRFVEASPGNASTSLVARLEAPGCHAVTLGGPVGSDPEESLLAACADLWTSGVDLDLDAVNGVGGLPYAQLPGYPFRRRRHWSHTPEAGPGGRPAEAGVLGRPVWRPCARPAGSHARALPATVTVRGEGPLADRLVQRLREGSVAVGQAAPGTTTAPGPVAGAVAGPGHVLVDLVTPSVAGHRVDLDDLADVGGWLRRRLLAPAADATRVGADRVLVVTRGARAVLPGEVPGTEEAGAVGLLRCLPHEQPGSTASWLDLPGPDASPDPGAVSAREADVEAVLDELRRPADRDAALREGVRYELGHEAVRPGATTTLRTDGTYLVLGGTGHLGAVVVDAVSREVRATLVLAGRDLARPRGSEHARLVERARERGCTVREVELDVTDGAAMVAVLDDLEATHGRVDGVFHLAAATEVDGFVLLEDDDDAAHARVAAAKVLGATHLARALRGRDVDLVCLFSSLSTVIGALRFGAYVSANALLDALAEGAAPAAGTDGCRWTSVVWDGWAADGVAGEDALGHEDGSELLRAVLRTRSPVVTATTREVESRRDSVVRDLLAVADSAASPSAPQDATLASVVRTVAEVTGHPSVEPEQRLASLGVDSLQMMQIAARLRRGGPHQVALGSLLRAGSVAEIAQALQGHDADARAGSEVGSAGPPPALEAVPPDALSTVQERLWFLDQLDPDGAGYHVPFGWRLPPGTTVAAAREAVRVLLDRHPVLRSAYRSDQDGRARRTELDAGSVEVVDLRADATEDDVRAQVERPLDLAHGSTRVLLRAGDPVELVLVCHHISIDAWSVRLLHEDLAPMLRGEALGPVPGSYLDFVRWERGRRSDPGFAADLGFWRDALHEVDSEPPPPDDGGRVVEPLGPSAATTLLVPAEVLPALRERVADQGATLFAAGLTGLALALSAWTRRGTSVLGTNMANRHTREVEGVVGMFVDPVVLALRPAEPGTAGEATTGSALAQVRRTLVAAMAHADVPYADVVEAVARTRPRSQPLISVIATMFDTEQGVSRDLVPLDLPQPGAAKFPLAVELLPRPDGLLLHALYARDLYRRESVGRVLSRTARYLQVLAERGADVPLRELEEPRSAARQRFAGRFGGGSASSSGRAGGSAG